MSLAVALLLLAGGLLIGILLSLLGAGGSILLLPLLVSGVGLASAEAVPLSLIVVALLAGVSAVPGLRRRCFAPGPALMLGLPSLAGSWFGGALVRADWVPEAVQLLLFTGTALAAAVMLLRGGRTPHSPAPVRVHRQPASSLLIGLLIGLLTGVAGVGGGFAIVPALVLLAGLPMLAASCTSLVLICLNALVALLAQGHWPAASLPTLAPLLLGGMVGSLLGQQLAPHLRERQLRSGFAALLLLSALITLLEAWQRARPSLPLSLEPLRPWPRLEAQAQPGSSGPAVFPRRR